jgi:hypothetical protein
VYPIAAGESQPALLYFEKFGLRRRIVGRVGLRFSFGGALVATAYLVGELLKHDTLRSTARGAGGAHFSVANARWLLIILVYGRDRLSTVRSHSRVFS